MNKRIIIFLCAICAVSAFAQKEKMKQEYASWGGIIRFLEKENIYKDIFKDPDQPNKDKAETAAWNAFNYAFSLEGLPQNVIFEVWEPSALKKVNTTMGYIGNSLAVLQIAIDYSDGDNLKAASNATKTSMFYVIGKWGWKSLKIAGTGLQVFDYMLTSFGEMAVSARQEALRDAYFDYYRNFGKRDLKTWKAIIEKLDGQAAIQKEIDGYLDKYGQASALDKKISGGLITKKEVEAVKKEYLEEELLPYLSSLFLVLQKNARNETLNKIGNEYDEIYNKLIKELNSKNRYEIYLDAPQEKIALCKAGIQVMTEGKWKLYVKGSFNEEGRRTLSFTKYSLVVNKVDSVRAILLCEAASGQVMYHKSIDLKKDKMEIHFDLPEEEVVEEEVIEDESATEKEEIQKQDKIDKANEKQPVQADLTGTTQALLTINGGPMNVTIKMQKETGMEYIGNVVHKRFPKKNTLTINKQTQAMTLVYKLKGAFAPELICKGLPIALNTYSGIIVTNDKNAVKVGTFSLVLLSE